MNGLQEVCSFPERIKKIWLSDRDNEDVSSWIIPIHSKYTEDSRQQSNPLFVYWSEP